MKKAILGALLAMAAMGAQAATLQAVESSAVVNGTIVLATDGTVQSAIIDNPAKYGQAIADFVHNTAMQWHFQPVLQDGQPVVAKASMHARVVLKQKPDGNFEVRIKGATFGDDDPNDTSTLHNSPLNKKLVPGYPMAAVKERVQGTVYLALHVNRSGHVIDAVALQVNLGVLGQESTLKRYREILARSARQAANRWTYEIPTTGKLAQQNSWTVRVPVIYNLNVWGAPKPDHTWQTYVPGPYTPAPWVDKPDADAADAVADGTVQTDGAGPTLLSAASNHG